MDKKTNRTSIFIGCLLAIGLLYAMLHMTMGLSIPCIFYKITGLYCPGCGVSTMCLALLRLDFKAAFIAQPAIMICLPIMALLFLNFIILDTKKSRIMSVRAENITIYLVILIMMAYCIYRNMILLTGILKIN